MLQAHILSRKQSLILFHRCPAQVLRDASASSPWHRGIPATARSWAAEWWSPACSPSTLPQFPPV